MSAQTYKVTVTSLNIRNSPEMADNKIGEIPHGELINLVAGLQQLTNSGWVFRRLEGSDENWIAEFNQNTGQRLIELVTTAVDTSPSTDTIDNIDRTTAINSIRRTFSADHVEPDHPDSGTEHQDEAYVVIAETVNIRNTPNLAGTILRKLIKGDKVQLSLGQTEADEKGWVRRKIANTTDEWVAELNTKTGEILLLKQSDKVLGRVQTDGTHFLVDGKRFRFVGANLREFAFYGRGLSHAIHTHLDHRNVQLEALKGMGMKVVRFHVCHKDVETSECIKFTREALDLLASFDMFGILCLNDSLGHSDCYVKGDMAFHEHDHSMGHVDKTYFIDGGYKQNFLPFVDAITRDLANHTAIFAWELGNEYALHPQPANDQDGQAFLIFIEQISSLIRKNDPFHLITTGLINTGQVTPAGHDGRDFARLIYRLPTIDFGTVHFYQDVNQGDAPFALEEERSRIDLEILSELQKPLIVEEFSATIGGRDAYTLKKLQEWFSMGAGGFMQWAVTAMKEKSDVGDNLRGMDIHRGDWESLVKTYRDWAASL